MLVELWMVVLLLSFCDARNATARCRRNSTETRRDQVEPSGFCAQFKTCYPCTQNGCGFCSGSGCGGTSEGCYNKSLVLEDGDRVCQHDGDDWYPREIECIDPCGQYSSTCTGCIQSVYGSCGWCFDGAGCRTGSGASGPAYINATEESCRDWRWKSDGPLACDLYEDCSSIQDCETCLASTASATERCVYCGEAHGCHRGTCPRPAVQSACPTDAPTPAPTAAPVPPPYQVPLLVILLMFIAALVVTGICILLFVYCFKF